jgi:hypothetical protein
MVVVGFSGNFRNQNGGGMGGRSNFMDQSSGNRGGMNRYPEGGPRDFSRPNVPQFPGGSRGDRRPDFEVLPPPPSKSKISILHNNIVRLKIITST